MLYAQQEVHDLGPIKLTADVCLHCIHSWSCRHAGMPSFLQTLDELGHHFLLQHWYKSCE